MNEAAWRRRGVLYVPLLLLLSWEAASRLPSFPLQTLSHPVAVAQAMLVALANGTLLSATGQTLVAALLGTLLGAVLGAAGGFLTGISLAADRSSGLLVEFLRPIPGVAIMPLALLVFGFGLAMEVAVIAFATLWPVLIMMRGATRNVDRQMLEVARVLEFSRLARFSKFLLPSVLREAFVALQLAVGVAFVVAVTVEIAINPMGLGYQLVSAQAALNADLVFASLVWVGIVGWATSACIGAVRQRLFRWSAQS